ncbi:hypothetical protein BC827DRAFT_1135199 [Russula dissimulans]|nr:hypothetical protein BC827DRAFT_1135199 [Russula dissimulans]
MIVLLAILAATRAYPVGLQSPPIQSLDQLHSSSCHDPNNCRSLWDIIRSCALTIFLCTWVSVHPNIPSPHEGWPRVTLRRMGLMLATLIMPEAIIGWALRQRLAAGQLAKQHKGEGWTLTHGFFATMGGFMAYEGNEPIYVLLPKELESYSLTGNGDFPRISKMEIQDKSKGDFVSKAVVILQTTWFVMQCIARGVQGLPITELELATIAFAGLNFVLYLLWWDKPLNVQCGVRVYKKRITDSPVEDGHVEATVGCWVALGDALSKLPAAIVHGPLEEDSFLEESGLRWPWPARVLAWPVIKPFDILVGGYHDEVGKRVGTFYPREWEYWSKVWRLAMVIAVIASAFGGIHCIGWSFIFPSSTEKKLWHVASVSITSIPVPLFLLLFLLESDLLDDVPDWLHVNTLVFERIITLCVVLHLFLYVLSRLVLLILPFLCLRSLPPAAYHTVRWTSFIPHI